MESSPAAWIFFTTLEEKQDPFIGGKPKQTGAGAAGGTLTTRPVFTCPLILLLRLCMEECIRLISAHPSPVHIKTEILKLMGFYRWKDK